MGRSWSIAKQITLAMLVVLIVAVAVLVPTVLTQMRRAITEAQHRELIGYQQSFAALVASSSDQAEAMARLVAGMPPVRAAFAAGDRDLLAGWFVPGFAALKDSASVGQFQFHLPPAISFLRVHKPEKYGDDLSGFRQTVVEANAQGRVIKGVESGVAGLGVRGVVPIFAPVAQGGQAVGTVEFGMRFDRGFVAAFRDRFAVDVSVLALQGDGTLKPLASSRDDGAVLSSEVLAQATSGADVFQQGEAAAHPYGVMAMALTDYAGAPVAVVEVVMDSSVYQQAYGTMRSSVLAITAVILLLGAGLAVVIGRSLSKPLRAMTAAMHGLADGDVATMVPGGGRTDELREMAQALTVFQAQAVENQTLHAHEKELEEQARSQRAGLMAQVRGEFNQAIGGIVSGLSGSAVTLRATAEGMAASAEETSRQASAVRSGAASASLNVDAVASAAEQLSASVAVISAQVQDSTAMIAQAVSEAEKTNGLVSSLSGAADEIGEVVNLITSIAEQTNLLALNATIEAARAGDAGKGFAVVASEVKQLAHQTEMATGRIADQVRAVQDHTQQAVRAIDHIGRTISSVEKIVIGIAGAVEEQNTATGAIARNVHDVACATQDVSSNIAGVSAAAGETGVACHNVLDTAGVLAQQSEQLKTVAERFIDRLSAA
jgi:methyl-accepting chemotaxis protein